MGLRLILLAIVAKRGDKHPALAGVKKGSADPPLPNAARHGRGTRAKPWPQAAERGAEPLILMPPSAIPSSASILPPEPQDCRPGIWRLIAPRPCRGGRWHVVMALATVAMAQA